MKLDPALLLTILGFEDDPGAAVDDNYAEVLEMFETGSVTIPTDRGDIVLTLTAELQPKEMKNETQDDSNS